MTPAELEASLAMLRRQGVKSFVDVAGGGFTVEFFAPEAVEPDTKREKPDICKCGHGWDEHHMGLCIAKNGGPCDPMKCSPEE